MDRFSKGSGADCVTKIPSPPTRQLKLRPGKKCTAPSPKNNKRFWKFSIKNTPVFDYARYSATNRRTLHLTMPRFEPTVWSGPDVCRPEIVARRAAFIAESCRRLPTYLEAVTPGLIARYANWRFASGRSFTRAMDERVLQGLGNRARLSGCMSCCPSALISSPSAQARPGDGSRGQEADCQAALWPKL